MGDRCEHGVTPADECEECVDGAVAQMVRPYVGAAYAKGRADERAAVVAWLLSIGHADDYADRVEYGEHVDAAKGKP